MVKKKKGMAGGKLQRCWREGGMEMWMPEKKMWRCLF